MRDELYANDAVWARFYRDCKDLGQISEEFGCSIYDLSPWLYVPLIRYEKGLDEFSLKKEITEK